MYVSLLYIPAVKSDAEPLVMYGQPSDAEPLDWGWVDQQLREVGTYWVVSRGARRPNPRPVWGVWIDRTLHLSIGSPTVIGDLRQNPLVSVHLDSGTDVVILEGAVTGSTGDAELLRVYDAKYDWEYDVDEYGPLTSIAPSKIMAWRSAGWAGRDGFQQAGRWQLGSAD